MKQLATYLLILWPLPPALAAPQANAAPQADATAAPSAGQQQSGGGLTEAAPAPAATSDAAATAAAATAAPTAAAPTAAASDAELPTVEAVQSQLDAAEADQAMAESVKTRLTAAYRGTLDLLKSLASERERQAALVAAAQTAPQRIGAAKQTLETIHQQPLPPDPPVDLFAATAVEQLRNRVSEAESQLNQARQARQEWDDKQRERQTRAASLTSLIADARTALADTIDTTVGEQAEDPHGTVREAREKQRLVAIAMARQRLATLQAEQVMIEAETGLLPLQIEVAAADVRRAQSRLRERTEQLGQQKQYRIENDLIELQQLVAEADGDIEQTRVWPLHKRWLQLTQDNARVRKQTTEYRAGYDSLDAIYKEISTEIGRDLDSGEGLRSGLGLKLLRIRSRLPSSSQLRSEARAVDERLEGASEFQSAVDHARDGYAELSVGGGSAELVAAAPGPSAAAAPNGQSQQALTALERTLLAAMAADVESHISDLIDLKSAIELKRRKSVELQNKIETNVIWIRDTARFRWSGMASAWESLQAVVAVDRWWQAGRAILAVASVRLDWTALWVILAIFPPLIYHRWTRSLSRPLSRQTLGRSNSGSGGNRPPASHWVLATIRQLLASLYQAMPLPATLWIAGALLSLATGAAISAGGTITSGGTISFGGAVPAAGTATSSASSLAPGSDLFAPLADALQATAWWMLPLAWLNQLLRPDGVVERDFRYRRDQTQPARRAARGVLWLGTPLCLLWQTASQPQWVDGDGTLARLLFVLVMGLAASASRYAFHPEHGSLAQTLRDQPDSWAARLRGLWFAIPLLPLTFALLSLAGYSYAATLLAQRMHWSLWFAIALGLTSGVLTRWIQVRRTQRVRLRESFHLLGGANPDHVPVSATAAAHAVAHAAARAVTHVLPHGSGPGDISRLVARAAPVATARAADAQPILPPTAAVAAITAGGIGAGGGVGDPAQRTAEESLVLAELDAQTLRLLHALLWTIVLVGTVWLWMPVLPAVRLLERVELWPTVAADGTIVSITLANLVMALPIVFLTWVAARNVPGLIETVLLERLPLDRPARYAITSLASYAIIVIGILLSAQTIGIRWQSVQWLVAALGVGLGFGMQEIFGNFISGLILLFEQPIRVGDTVTIGDTTGTVSRIRMRSTIVTNGQRQDLVIPNKMLITERLINWTLTDNVNRIEIRLNLNHQADTQAACRLLEQICNQHESILVDPKPTITFDSFSESGLTIVVACYLGQLSQRLQTQHELNTAIKQRFQEAGIELAAPLRDVRLHSVTADVLPEDVPPKDGLPEETSAAD